MPATGKITITTDTVDTWEYYHGRDQPKDMARAWKNAYCKGLPDWLRPVKPLCERVKAALKRSGNLPKMPVPKPYCLMTRREIVTELGRQVRRLKNHPIVKDAQGFAGTDTNSYFYREDQVTS